MSDTLNQKEVDQLMDLFNKIKLDLSDSSFPTRTDKVPTEPTKFTDALDHHEIMQKGIVR